MYVCVLEPPGDMLYFEVIKLFNCVSIFWNGIISSLKNVFKNTIILRILFFCFNECFLKQHEVSLRKTSQCLEHEAWTAD